MKNLILVAMFLFLLSLFSCRIGSDNNKSTIVSGEVSIVSNGTSNIKLGAVTISVFPENTMQANIDGAQPVFDQKIDDYLAKLDKCKDSSLTPRHLTELCRQSAQADLSQAAAACFKNLPAPIAQATTDAEGKFNLTIPKPGRYAAIVQFTRTVFDKDEFCFWAVSFEARGEPQTLLLSSGNKIFTDASENMIKSDKAINGLE